MLVLVLVPKRCVFGWLGECGECAADAYYSGVAVGGWLLVGAEAILRLTKTRSYLYGRSWRIAALLVA